MGHVYIDRSQKKVFDENMVNFAKKFDLNEGEKTQQHDVNESEITQNIFTSTNEHN